MSARDPGMRERCHRREISYVGVYSARRAQGAFHVSFIYNTQITLFYTLRQIGLKVFFKLLNFDRIENPSGAIDPLIERSRLVRNKKSVDS